MKKVTRYISDDGKEFATEQECLRHEIVNMVINDFNSKFVSSYYDETHIDLDGKENQFIEWILKIADTIRG